MPFIWESISVRTRKNGLLEHRFTYKEERHSVYGRSNKECWENREKLIAGESKKHSVSKPTIGEWVERYYKTYKIKKDGTKINPENERHIKYIKAAKLGSKQIHRASGMDIQEFLREFDDRPNTQHKIKTFLNAAFKKAVPRIIRYNPCDDVELERHQYESYNAIQPAEQVRILEAIDNDKFCAVFWYMCCTGLRLENALASLDCIDFQNCIIAPQKKDTVTKKHRVRIPFLPELLTPERVELLKQCDYRDIEYYFFKLFKRLDLPLVVHSFRKTFASCAYHVGFSDKWIQMALGHKTMQMTQDTYIELIDNADSPLLDYFRRLKQKLYPDK